jgi:hypothetical protein
MLDSVWAWKSMKVAEMRLENVAVSFPEMSLASNEQDFLMKWNYPSESCLRNRIEHNRQFDQRLSRLRPASTLVRPMTLLQMCFDHSSTRSVRFSCGLE